MPASRINRVAAPLREQVLDSLRADLLGAEFEPGERLVEARLCERYEVSRTVVREVLRQLESEGLVSIVANRGPIVAELDPADAEALFEVRAALEALAGSLFAQRATPEQRKRLRETLRALRKSGKGEGLAAHLALKDEFYGALVDGADNEVIRTTLRGIHARTQMLRGLSMQVRGRRAQMLRELSEIVDAAVVRKDPEAARQACERHVHKASEVALAELRERLRTSGKGAD